MDENKPIPMNDRAWGDAWKRLRPVLPPGLALEDAVFRFGEECFMAGAAFARAQADAELARLRDLAQGRLEHFQHSEKSRGAHFMRAETAREALREIIRMIDSEYPLGNGHALRKIADAALAEQPAPVRGAQE